jgi:hypothetical protein
VLRHDDGEARSSIEITAPRAARGRKTPHGGRIAQERRHAGRLVVAAGEEDVSSQSVGLEEVRRDDIRSRWAGRK